MFYVFINKKENGKFDIDFTEESAAVAKGALAVYEFDDSFSAQRYAKMLRTYPPEMIDKIISKENKTVFPNPKRDTLKKKQIKDTDILDKILNR